MACYHIMAVIVSQRSHEARKVQDILTKNGCIIKMRVGMHDAGDVCSEEGLIILQLSGTIELILDLMAELNGVEGVTAKEMEICSE